MRETINLSVCIPTMTKIALHQNYTIVTYRCFSWLKHHCTQDELAGESMHCCIVTNAS